MIIGDHTDKLTKSTLKYSHIPRYNSKTLYSKIKDEIISLSDKNFDGLISFYENIQDGIIKVKIFDQSKLHTKLYLFHRVLPEEFGGTLDDKGIFGSSNLSTSGLRTNVELNAVFNSKEENQWLTNYFHELWQSSQDYNDKILRIIESTPKFKKKKKK